MLFSFFIFVFTSQVFLRAEPVELVWRVEIEIIDGTKKSLSSAIDLPREAYSFDPGFKNVVACHVSQAERDWDIPGDLRSLTCKTNFNDEVAEITTAIACSLDSPDGNTVALVIKLESGIVLYVGLLCVRVHRGVIEQNVFNPVA